MTDVIHARLFAVHVTCRSGSKPLKHLSFIADPTTRGLRLSLPSEATHKETMIRAFDVFDPSGCSVDRVRAGCARWLRQSSSGWCWSAPKSCQAFVFCSLPGQNVFFCEIISFLTFEKWSRLVRVLVKRGCLLNHIAQVFVHGQKCRLERVPDKRGTDKRGLTVHLMRSPPN